MKSAARSRSSIVSCSGWVRLAKAQSPAIPTSTSAWPVKYSPADSSLSTIEYLDRAVAEGGVLSDVEYFGPAKERHQGTDGVAFVASVADEAADIVGLARARASSRDRDAPRAVDA